MDRANNAQPPEGLRAHGRGLQKVPRAIQTEGHRLCQGWSLQHSHGQALQGEPQGGAGLAAKGAAAPAGCSYRGRYHGVLPRPGQPAAHTRGARALPLGEGHNRQGTTTGSKKQEKSEGFAEESKR